MKLNAWYAGGPQGTPGTGARLRGLTGTTGMPYAGVFAHRPVCIAAAVKASSDANGKTERPTAPPGGDG